MKTLAFASGRVATFAPRRPALVALGQQLREFLRILHRCNPILSGAGWVNVALAVVALALAPLDERVVTGLNVWFKPLKFALSSVIYLWSLGWLLADLPAPVQRAVHRISWGVAISIMVEIMAIFGQAARGTASHFNNAFLFDGVVFGLMGVFIAVNTVLLVWALYLTLRYRPFGPAAYVWGMRLGLLLFLVGSAVGGVMIRQAGHTVGAPDGGPGLPVLGWSTRAGDLRAAHFLGLHALQALPLVGWVANKYSPRRGLLVLGLGTVGYVVLIITLYAQALGGISPWASA